MRIRRVRAKNEIKLPCRVCGCELFPLKNWSNARVKRGDYICSPCQVKRSTSWRINNPEARLNYLRRFTLHTDGKSITLKEPKREFPSDHKCELCGEFTKILSYHHFDDLKPHIGIWVCSQKCHGLCETVDKHGIEITQRYLELKAKIRNS